MERPGIVFHISNKALFALWAMLYGLSIQWVISSPFSIYANGFFWACLSAALFGLCRLRMSKETSLCIMAAFIYYVAWFYLWPNYRYTNDLDGHMGYIRHIVRFGPGGFITYDGRESWHPPVYYWFMGYMYHVAGAVHAFNPRYVLRAAALFLYMIFVLFSVRTLRASVDREDGLYYLGLCLILFWPSSLLYVTRINNDVAMYAIWAAFFYYLTEWYRKDELGDLRRVFICLGIAAAIKSSALTLFGIMGVCVLYALFRRKLHWPQLLKGSIWYGYAACLAGLALNAGMPLIRYMVLGKHTASLHFGAARHVQHVGQYLVSFDVMSFVNTPFRVTGKELPDAWSYLFHTLVNGEAKWKLAMLANIHNLIFIIWLFLALILVSLLLLKHKESRHRLFPFAAAIVVSLAALFGFFWYKTFWACLNARFIFPFIVPFIILLVHAQAYAMRSRPAVQFMSCMVSVAGGTFIVIGSVFFIGQYWPYCLWDCRLQ